MKTKRKGFTKDESVNIKSNNYILKYFNRNQRNTTCFEIFLTPKFYLVILIRKYIFTEIFLQFIFVGSFSCTSYQNLQN